MTNTHDFVVETALDSLDENLKIDCGWIQLTSPFSQYPHLASFRNFTDEIHHEMSRIDLNNYFIEQVVGLGNKIVVPNLNAKSAGILAVFRKAGFHSLIAVPITTYKVLGIMGAAFRKKRTFSKDYINLIALISNLVGMALSKNMIIEHTLSQDYSLPIDNPPEVPDMTEVLENKRASVIEQEEALDDKQLLVSEKEEAFDDKRLLVAEEEEAFDDKRLLVAEEEEAFDDKRLLAAEEEEAFDDKIVPVVEEEALDDEIVPVVEDRLIIDNSTHTEESEEIFQKHARLMTNFRRSHGK